MKHWVIVVMGLIIIMALAACGTTEEEGVDTSSFSGSPAAESPSSDQERPELPESMRLILGTLQLEDTELEVSPGQAEELLILWKAFRSLGNSDNQAVEELNALVMQIREAMTSEQLDAIAGMEIGQGDFFALAQEFGMVPEGAEGLGQGGSSGDSAPGGGFPEGGFRGVGPSGQGPGGLGGEVDPQALATLRAERGGSAGIANRAASYLLDPLIELLESKLE
jgi:hypothetical protein